MNYVKLLNILGKLVKEGQIKSINEAIQMVQKMGAQVDGLLKQGIENLFKTTKARNPQAFEGWTPSVIEGGKKPPLSKKEIFKAMEDNKGILEASKKTVQEPLWKELGFTNREEFLVTEASMGNPWAKKSLEKLRKEKEGVESLFKKVKDVDLPEGVDWKDTPLPFNPKVANFYDELVENAYQESKKTGRDVKTIIEETIGYKFTGNETSKEILDIVEKKFFKADGGRIGFRRGGRGRQDPMGGHAHQTADEMRAAAPDQFGGGMNISHGGGGEGPPSRGGGGNLNISPVVTYKGPNQIDHLGLRGNLGKLMAAGLVDLEDVLTTGNIDPTIAANLNLGDFNLGGIKNQDQTGIFASGNIGPVNVGGTYQDFGDYGTAKNIGASGTLGNLGMNVTYDFENNPNVGLSYNNPDSGLSGGVNYNFEGTPEGVLTLSKKFKKGGRVGFQQGGIGEGGSTSLASLQRQGYKPYDSRATVQDFAKALRSVSGGTTYQQQADARRYARNQASQMLDEAAKANPQARGIENIYNTFFKNQNVTGVSPIAFGRSGSGTNPEALMYYRLDERDNILDAMANQMLDTTQYSQPKINERREKEFADYMNNLVSSTYGKADDYKAEAMTLGMPTSAYFDYLVTSDPKDVMTSYDTLSRDPYFDPKTYVPTDYSNPETPRPPSPYDVYFQGELQRQTAAGIPVGQRIQHGQVMGLPTVLTGPPQSGTINPGYQPYEVALAQTKKQLGLKQGGRVGYDAGGLTGQAKNIYDSWIDAGHSEEDVLAYLESRGLYNTEDVGITSIVNTQKPIIPQGDGGDGGGNIITRPSYKYTSQYDQGKTIGPQTKEDFINWLTDIGEGTIPKDDITWGTQWNELKHQFSQIPTPYNLAKKGIGGVKNWFNDQQTKVKNIIQQQAEEKARQDQLKRELDALALQGRVYGTGGGRDESLNLGPDGSYTGRGDVGATTANQRGEFATDSLSYDLKEGGQVGLATMFTRRR